MALKNPELDMDEVTNVCYAVLADAGIVEKICDNFDELEIDNDGYRIEFEFETSEWFRNLKLMAQNQLTGSWVGNMATAIGIDFKYMSLYQSHMNGVARIKVRIVL